MGKGLFANKGEKEICATVAEASTAGTYDVILDFIGGDTLAAAIAALSRDGGRII